MGGVWTPPLKLVDGVWLGLDAQWVDKAGWRGFFCAGSRTRYCSLQKAAAKAQPGLIRGDRPSATPGNWPLCPNGIPSAHAYSRSDDPSGEARLDRTMRLAPSSAGARRATAACDCRIGSS